MVELEGLNRDRTNSFRRLPAGGEFAWSVGTWRSTCREPQSSGGRLPAVDRSVPAVYSYGVRGRPAAPGRPPQLDRPTGTTTLFRTSIPTISPTATDAGG